MCSYRSDIRGNVAHIILIGYDGSGSAEDASDGHAGHAHHAEDHAGGHAEHDHAAIFRRRFWISLGLSVPVFAFSETIRDWLGLPSPGGAEDVLVSLFGIAVFAYGGQPFLTDALSELRSCQPGMMTLISQAITVAFAASIATVLGVLDLEFWWELAALIDVMLLGHWLEMRAVGQARGALAALAASATVAP
jgi:Cu2+-exporting ATPase